MDILSGTKFEEKTVIKFGVQEVPSDQIRWEGFEANGEVQASFIGNEGVEWNFGLMGLQGETFSCHSLGAQNFNVAPKFSEKLCTTGISY